MRPALYTPRYKNTRVYIDVCCVSNMEQKLVNQSPLLQEVDVEKSIGNLFEEFLTKKNRLAEFDSWSKRTQVLIDGKTVRTNGDKGLPKYVSQILKMIIKPTQVLKFQPIIAGG